MKKYIYWVLLSIVLLLSACASSSPKLKNKLSSDYPLHFLGTTPEAKYQLDLLLNRTYFLKNHSTKEKQTAIINYEVGKWHIDESARLVLKNAKDKPRFFSIIDKNTIESIDSNYTLKASEEVKTLAPRIILTGIYRYMADAALFKECVTGIQYPVAFEKDYIALERSYLRTIGVVGDGIKIKIDAEIALRDAVDNKGKKPTIVVKKFIEMLPREVCNNPHSKASLQNTYWKLTMIEGKSIKYVTKNKREPHMILQDSKIKGHSGCNAMSGSYELKGDKLSFSDKGMMMTKMFCRGSVERDFLSALKSMYRYEIKGEFLEIFDKKDTKLAQFESVYLY